jgi:F-type H+-transporting ATPase subunit b
MRRSLVLLTVVLAVFASVLLAAPCRAEEGAEHAAEKPGLLSVDWYTSAATVVVFVVLLVILSKTAWKPIIAGLRAREQGIREQIEGAEKANADAKSLLSEYQGRLTAAAEEAKKIVDEGRKDAEALAARIHADAKAEAGKERERTLRDIELARQQAVKDVYDEVATVATEVAAKIVQQKLDASQHKRLVEDGFTLLERQRKSAGSRA